MILDQYSKLMTKDVDGEGEVGTPTIPNKWAYIAMIDRLANGDATKHNDVYEMNFIYCLNILGYYHDRDAYVEQMNKRQEKRRK